MDGHGCSLVAQRADLFASAFATTWRKSGLRRLCRNSRGLQGAACHLKWFPETVIPINRCVGVKPLVKASLMKEISIDMEPEGQIQLAKHEHN